MWQEKTFHGAMTALVTPFKQHLGNLEIDEKALANLCEKQIQAGISGLVPCGTTGETPTLLEKERLRVLQVVMEANKGRVPIIAGVGSNSTAQTLSLALQAKQAKADALLVVTPYYNRPTQEGLYQHYKALVDAVDMPIFLYNVPSRTGCDLLPDTVERLCAFKQIIGIKEASGQIHRTQQLIGKLGDRLIVLSGDDAINYPLYAIGAKGCISVASNLLPEKVAGCWNAYEKGNHPMARTLHDALLPIAEALFIESSPTPVKTALSWRGEMDPHVRLPLCALSPNAENTLRHVLQKQGIIQ